MKIYIEGTSSYECSYSKLFKSMGFTVVDKVSKDVDLVCFTGGADVSPDLYGQVKHRATHCRPERDKVCMDLFNFCLENDIPMVGICRGSQFLCVANKGSLYQDIDGHIGNHMAVDSSNKVMEVTSTHHQEMNPVNGVVIMTANSGNYRTYMSEHGLSTTVKACTPTVEAVFWPETNCLGVQGHPEFPSASKDFVNWFKDNVRSLVCAD